MPDVIDTPLTRLKAEYDAKLLVKDVLIVELQNRIEDGQEKLARVKGISQMLRLLLADMAAGVSGLSQQVDMMARNIAELRQKLPEPDE